MHHHCAKTSHAVQTDDRKRTDGRGPAAGIPFCDVCLQKEGLLIEVSHLRIPVGQVMLPWPESNQYSLRNSICSRSENCIGQNSSRGHYTTGQPCRATTKPRPTVRDLSKQATSRHIVGAACEE